MLFSHEKHQNCVEMSFKLIIVATLSSCGNKKFNRQNLLLCVNFYFKYQDVATATRTIVSPLPCDVRNVAFNNQKFEIRPI